MIATINNPNWIRVSYVTMAFPLPEGKEAKPSMIKGQPPNVYKDWLKFNVIAYPKSIIPNST